MLVFLDIDGVMVPAKSWKSPELLDDGFPSFSFQSTYVLQNIIADSTTVYLTTSHKSSYSTKEWQDIFLRRGIKIKILKSLGANTHHLSRKDEILNWFTVNPTDQSFVIIDDDTSLNSLPLYLKDHLSLTSPMVGLTHAHLEQIDFVLNRDFQFA
jgi:hypothetical protein